MTGRPVGATEEERCYRQAYEKATGVGDPLRFIPSDTLYFEYSPITGVRPVANLSRGRPIRTFSVNGSTVMHAATLFTTDAHTRGIGHVSLEKNRTRIAVLGDSFTWGAESGRKFTYPHILGQLLLDAEVLNYGIEDTGIDTMYLRWKYEVLPFRPDAVVLTVYYGDYSRARPCVHKPRLVLEDGRIRVENMPPPSYEEIARMPPPPVGSYLWSYLRYLAAYKGDPDGHYYREGLRLFRAMVREMRSVSREQNTTLLVVLIDEAPVQQTPRVAREVIEESVRFLNETGVPYLLSSELFRRYNYTLNTRRRHFLPPGYAYLAQGVKERLPFAGRTPSYVFSYSSKNFLLVIREPGERKAQVVPEYDVFVNGTRTTPEDFFSGAYTYWLTGRAFGTPAGRG